MYHRLIAIVAAPPLFLALAPTEFRELVGRAWATLIAVVVAVIAWRLAIAGIDRFYARRFVSRLLPRVSTIASLTKSLADIVILVALVLLLLNVWAVNVTPAVWSAGIVTAALAFGAQTIVRDMLTGFFFLFEDQYDVGDAVKLTTTTNAVVSGTVESIGLRTTRLVDERGCSHVVANGSILFVSNESRLPSRAMVTLALPLKAPIADMRAKLADIVKNGAAQSGVPTDNVSINVEDVSSDRVTFRIEFVAARAVAQDAEARVREHVIDRLQAVGWLPGAAAPVDGTG